MAGGDKMSHAGRSIQDPSRFGLICTISHNLHPFSLFKMIFSQFLECKRIFPSFWPISLPASESSMSSCVTVCDKMADSICDTLDHKYTTQPQLIHHLVEGKWKWVFSGVNYWLFENNALSAKNWDVGNIYSCIGQAARQSLENNIYCLCLQFDWVDPSWCS